MLPENVIQRMLTENVIQRKLLENVIDRMLLENVIQRMSPENVTRCWKSFNFCHTPSMYQFHTSIPTTDAYLDLVH
jgi:hypothetical protein